MKKNELHQKSASQLTELLMKAEKELTALKMQKAMAKLKDLHELSKKKKEIARIKTIITEKKNVEEKK